MSTFGRRVVIQSEDGAPVQLRLELDATLSETHRNEVEVPKHPLERGADVADHIRFLAKKLEVVGVVSNTPIVTLATGPTASVAGGDPTSRAEDAYRALRSAMSAGTLCTVTSSLDEYKGMVLTGLSVTRDVQSGNIAAMQMTWEELLFAETLSVAVPVPENASQSNRKDLGKQGTTEAKPAVRTSVLFDVKSYALRGTSFE